MLRSESAANPQLLEAALAGLRAYQEAPRTPPLRLMPVIGESHGATMRDYGGEGPNLLFVPSLINPPNILDLNRERSLLRWLAERGFRVLLLDWGWDVQARAELGIAGHVEKILLPLMANLAEPPHLAGYCLGGTMAAAAAQLAPVRSLVTIATPWHFAAFPEESRAQLKELWDAAKATAEALGALPMEAMQNAFWNLDPARTVGKFAAFAAMPPGSDQARAFVTLEDWANDGPPIPLAAARELFEGFFEADQPGAGTWQVGGETIEPGGLVCPRLDIASTTDRIVPEASAIPTADRIALTSGHVGMMVGSKSRETLWEPLAEWLERLD